jgi:hypothetical protein
MAAEGQEVMSGASYKRCDPFNPMQIKDGWIVRVGKDGRIREKIEKYPREKVKRNK